MSLLSVGSTIDLVDAVCKGDIQNGMAIIRYKNFSDKKTIGWNYVLSLQLFLGLQGTML